MASGGIIWRTLCSLLLCIKGIFRKVICRISGRQRKNSGSILPLTQEHIGSDMQHPVPTNNEYELQPWDSWDASDSMGGGFHGSSARYGTNNMEVNQRTSQQPAEPPPEPDFFEDMTPTIKKNPKILIKKNDDNYMNSGISSRLAFSGDVPAQVNP